MRRVAAVMLMVLTLTSCAPKEATPVTSGFSCVVDVSYDETAYRGTLEVPHDGAVELILSEPSAVAGLTLSFADERLTASFAGMELVLSDAQVPAAAVVRLL